MEALQTLEVRRVPSSADIVKPGNYCFIKKREPIERYGNTGNTGTEYGDRLRFHQKKPL